MERDAPVRPAHQHEHNLALVTRLAARSGPVSRARLAQLSGLTKSTVTQLVAELCDGGLVRELGTGRSSGPGRPANLLVLDSQGPAGIGLQVEADHVAGCLTDLTGRVADRAIRTTEDLRGAPERAARVAEPVLRRLLNAAISTERVVAGLVVGVPDGLGDAAPEIARRLEARLAGLGAEGIPVNVSRSAGLAARTELTGDHGGRDTVVYVGGEHAVEVGIVVDGVVRDAPPGSAGGLAHLRLRTGGASCACGAKGCLDTVAGLPAVLRAAGSPAPVRSRLVGGEGALPGLVRDGDPPAAAATRRAARALGEALAGIVAALGAGSVVLGGHYATLGEPFADAVGAALGSRFPGLAGEVAVRPSRLPPDAVARAAATAVIRRLIDDPARWLAQTS